MWRTRKVLGSVSGSCPFVIFGELHIESPVTLVLHRPMNTHRVSDSLDVSRWQCRYEIVGGFAAVPRRLVGALALHADKGADARPACIEGFANRDHFVVEWPLYSGLP